MNKHRPPDSRKNAVRDFQKPGRGRGPRHRAPAIIYALANFAACIFLAHRFNAAVRCALSLFQLQCVTPLVAASALSKFTLANPTGAPRYALRSSAIVFIVDYPLWLWLWGQDFPAPPAMLLCRQRRQRFPKHRQPLFHLQAHRLFGYALFNR